MKRRELAALQQLCTHAKQKTQKAHQPCVGRACSMHYGWWVGAKAHVGVLAGTWGNDREGWQLVGGDMGEGRKWSPSRGLQRAGRRACVCAGRSFASALQRPARIEHDGRAAVHSTGHRAQFSGRAACPRAHPCPRQSADVLHSPYMHERLQADRGEAGAAVTCCLRRLSLLAHLWSSLTVLPHTRASVSKPCQAGALRPAGQGGWQSAGQAGCCCVACSRITEQL